MLEYIGADQARVRYEADGACAVVPFPARLKRPKPGHCIANGAYKEAIRTWLEVTGVRVERLQAISDEDALAEGVDRTNTSIAGYARERFQRLWTSTGGDWDANPWVWVISFRRVDSGNGGG